ncbi:hypothetical protein JGI3_00952 [Candidatus Kryptobacter tengchongensis]|nr:hypothetical protein JGI3_00952 [Candidatus Kryptobacter tengchongensis]
MPLEELRPTNNYVTYDQLQRFLADRLEALEREIEAKLLQLKESKFNYLEEKLNLKTELEALKEQFRILNSEFITRITNLSYKVLEINNFFTQKLAEINQQFTELNTSLISEFERYRKDFYEFLSKNDLRTFFENNADLIPYLLSPMMGELNEFKNKLSAIETNLQLVQNFYTNISNEINKQISEIIKSTIDNVDSKVLSIIESMKESFFEKINSLEINGNTDIVGLTEFKNEISQLLHSINQDIVEIKNIYQNVQSSEPALPQIDFSQILSEIKNKIEELKTSQEFSREFIVPEIPDVEFLKVFSQEVQNNLNLLKKISEDIAINTSSLTLTSPANLDENLKSIDVQLKEIKNVFDEVATSQYEVQNNMGNLLEKVTVLTAEILNISKSFKKDITENLGILKAEISKELKTQKQDIISAVNSVNESIQSLKGYPAIIIFCTLLIIGAMILLKFVF